MFYHFNGRQLMLQTTDPVPPNRNMTNTALEMTSIIQ